MMQGSMGAGPIGVVLIDDHGVVREATESVLRSAGFRVWEGTGEAAHARELIRRARPDVAVVDLRLGGQSGIWLASQLAREHPTLRLIAFTAVDDPIELRAALAAPVHGIVRKSGALVELVEAIRTVAAGGRHVPVELALQLERAPRRTLSVREHQVLGLLADGLTAEEVAQRLSVSGATVRTHVRNAVARMGARTRTHAVAMALRTGELSADEERRAL